MEEIDVLAVAKEMEAHFKAALTLGLLSALVGILEGDEPARL
jgi:hypothetical protein